MPLFPIPRAQATLPHLQRAPIIPRNYFRIAAAAAGAFAFYYVAPPVLGYIGIGLVSPRAGNLMTTVHLGLHGASKVIAGVCSESFTTFVYGAAAAGFSILTGVNDTYRIF